MRQGINLQEMLLLLQAAAAYQVVDFGLLRDTLPEPDVLVLCLV